MWSLFTDSNVCMAERHPHSPAHTQLANTKKSHLLLIIISPVWASIIGHKTIASRKIDEACLLVFAFLTHSRLNRWLKQYRELQASNNFRKTHARQICLILKWNSIDILSHPCNSSSSCSCILQKSLLIKTQIQMIWLVSL